MDEAGAGLDAVTVYLEDEYWKRPKEVARDLKILIRLSQVQALTKMVENPFILMYQNVSNSYLVFLTLLWCVNALMLSLF